MNIGYLVEMNNLLDEAESAPEKAGRSKLEPVAEVVATLRRKRWSYREIAEFLKEKANLDVDPSTVFDFVKSQAKRERRGRRNAPISLPGERAKNETAVPAVPVETVVKTPIPNQTRSIYIPPANAASAFDASSLKTNDELEE